MNRQMESDVYFFLLDNYDRIQEYLDKICLKDYIKKGNFIAIKTHFGEKGNKGFVPPERIKPISSYIKKLGAIPFVTDTNTIYRGERTNAANHLQTALEHGFRMETCGAPIIIADGMRGNNYVEVEIDKKHLKKVKVARDIYEADFIIFISHVKGHMLTGFGGAIKNIGMGCAARAGKYEMHASLVPVININKCTACGTCIPHCAGFALKLVKKKISLDESKCVGCGDCILACPEKVFSLPWDRSPVDVSERMVEYAYGVLKNKPALFINFINYVTPHCDCLPSKEAPLIDDIGVVMSFDPVAADQSSIDLINDKAGCELFKKVHPQTDYNVQLRYAEEILLGNRKYKINRLD